MLLNIDCKPESIVESARILPQDDTSFGFVDIFDFHFSLFCIILYDLKNILHGG